MALMFERLGTLRRSVLGWSKINSLLIPGFTDGGKNQADLVTATASRLACVICVGSTGTGKSSTISKCLRVETVMGSGAELVTQACEVFRSEEQEEVWVDTRGWLDTDMEDDQIFRDILTFLINEKITHIAGIIWNVSPNIKSDLVLQGQAGLISQLHVEIWDHVLVLAKQSMKPAKDCQGALQAAATFHTEEAPGEKNVLFTGRIYSFRPDRHALSNFPRVKPNENHKGNPCSLSRI